MNNHDYTHSIIRFFGWVGGVILVILMAIAIADRAEAYTEPETGTVVVLADTIATPNIAQASLMWQSSIPANKAKLRLVVVAAISSGYFVKLAFIANRVSHGTGVDTPEEEAQYEKAGRYMLNCPIFMQPLDDFVEDVILAGEREKHAEQALSFAAFVIEYATNICAIANRPLGPKGGSV